MSNAYMCKYLKPNCEILIKVLISEPSEFKATNGPAVPKPLEGTVCVCLS